MTTYEAIEHCWNGCNYEPCGRHPLEAGTLEEAIAEVRAMEWGESDSSYDMRVDIVDASDDYSETLASEYFENDPAKNAQDSMDQRWRDAGEFSSECLGVRDGEWFAWSENGGTRGAHSREDGSGNWREVYDDPQSISSEAAAAWLVAHGQMDSKQAKEVVEEFSA